MSQFRRSADHGGYVFIYQHDLPILRYKRSHMFRSGLPIVQHDITVTLASAGSSPVPKSSPTSPDSPVTSESSTDMIYCPYRRSANAKPTQALIFYHVDHRHCGELTGTRKYALTLAKLAVRPTQTKAIFSTPRNRRARFSRPIFVSIFEFPPAQGNPDANTCNQFYRFPVRYYADR
ncbi:Hypothetical protein NTJ_10689 [Nesidiocoris tenuis]|uniref:Uncharacterized protein n=1 Tax=Nesidiocoris tenuis TaxID=355587 RepID=A0ABN7B3W5_9HEMI|nr:Hypothetical protein NTJ_10689 [Nesidiocoris tenuis]